MIVWKIDALFTINTKAIQFKKAALLGTQEREPEFHSAWLWCKENDLNVIWSTFSALILIKCDEEKRKKRVAHLIHSNPSIESPVNLIQYEIIEFELSIAAGQKLSEYMGQPMGNVLDWK